MRKALEEVYKKAANARIRANGLIITNPLNLLGTTLTGLDLMDFINEKRIHLVCDEIYTETVFRGPDFISIAEIIDEYDKGCCDRDLIHIIYSFSEDMGRAGFWIGVVYFYNDDVVHCGRKMSSFELVSSSTQHQITLMLSDNEFVDKFVADSSVRLAKRHEDFTCVLECVGIRCLESNAGLYIWMDLRELLGERTLKAEMALWREDIQTMDMDRIRNFIVENMTGDWGKVVRRKESKKVKVKLKVSFSNLRMEEMMKMPCSMSQCSPVPPYSPLVSKEGLECRC